MSQIDGVDRIPTISGLVPITEIMSRRLVTARPELPADRLVELFLDQHVGCVPIVNQAGRAIGIVTKLDVVECMKEGRPTARELMMPIAMSLDVHATVGQAARVMSAERIHHVLIVDDDRRLVGIVSALDVVHWLARNDGFVGE
jgi:CBS-domain-containing membrane protein